MKQLLYVMPGALFGAGLVLSGMTNPAKVIGFLDVAGGQWDPSLAFVMAGAIAVFGVMNQLIHRRSEPLMKGKLPGQWSDTGVTTQGLVGAAVFGLGWGLSGICPGPAIASLASGHVEIFVYITGLLMGMVVAQQVFDVDAPKSADSGDFQERLGDPVAS